MITAVFYRYKKGLVRQLFSHAKNSNFKNVEAQFWITQTEKLVQRSNKRINCINWLENCMETLLLILQEHTSFFSRLVAKKLIFDTFMIRFLNSHWQYLQYMVISIAGFVFPEEVHHFRVQNIPWSVSSANAKKIHKALNQQ